MPLQPAVSAKLKKFGVNVSDAPEEFASELDYIAYRLEATAIRADATLQALKGCKGKRLRILEIGPAIEFTHVALFMQDLVSKGVTSFSYTGVESLGELSQNRGLSEGDKPGLKEDQERLFQRCLEEFSITDVESQFIFGDASDPDVLSNESLASNFDVILLNEFPSSKPWYDFMGMSEEEFFDDRPEALAYRRGVERVWSRLSSMESKAVVVTFARGPDEIIDMANSLCGSDSKIYGGDLYYKSLVVCPKPPQLQSQLARVWDLRTNKAPTTERLLEAADAVPDAVKSGLSVHQYCEEVVGIKLGSP